ncbi:MAG: hydroxymethylglutaryl-CoA synthase [Pseudomonadota bacterium]|nr:hydroxymethylglutaryl-CoA synthase [Pseudomonadota bacterium]
MKVGLEAIAFDIPKFYVDMTELAHYRSIDPAKFTKGLGQLEMSVASPCEDTVTLAAGAAIKLMHGFNIDKESIGLCVVGTETPIDQSKPIASHIHEILGLPKNCRVFETKHACYGATAALAMATDWILSGRAQGKKAIIIASDIARYGLKTAGEPTQGAGAVAMLISDNPKLLELETNYVGNYSEQVMDFWRPTYSKEAFADGHFSIQCYLTALAGSYDAYRESFTKQHADAPEMLASRFAACLYHVPFVKMANKAHHKLIEHETKTKIEKDDPRMNDVIKDFNERVAGNLNLNARIGNVYTGSLYLSLFNFLEQNSAKNVGRAISLFSYGSGCTSEFFSGIVQPGAELALQKVSSQSALNSRIRIPVDHYEKMLNASAESDQNNVEVSDPKTWHITGPVLYLGNKDHKRQYAVNQ